MPLMSIFLYNGALKSSSNSGLSGAANIKYVQINIAASSGTLLAARRT